MVNNCCSQKRSSCWSLSILIYFIINLRVEAGIATTFERALDGLVGGVVLLLLLYINARFFKIKFFEPADENDLLTCCTGKKE